MYAACQIEPVAPLPVEAAGDRHERKGSWHREIFRLNIKSSLLFNCKSCNSLPIGSSFAVTSLFLPEQIDGSKFSKNTCEYQK